MIDKNEQEKDRELLHYLKKQMQNIEETTNPETIQTLVNNVSALQNSMPRRTSQLTNDSGFLTSHQNISGKENTSNKTTSISASPNNTKYPTEKAVVDYVENYLGNISMDVESENYIINMKLNEIQNQLVALGATINFTAQEISDGTRLTSVAEIYSLNSQFDSQNFNNFAHEKIPFTTKGSNGPTAVVLFRQAPLLLLTPTIELKFFLRNLPNGNALPVIISLNGRNVFSGNLTVESGQTFQASLTLSNLTTTAFNKLQIAFNSSTLANVQLDYLDISISNTQNCIIFNRDETFSISVLKNSAGNIYTSSTLHKENIQTYGFLTNPTTETFLNPPTTVPRTADSDNNSFHTTIGALYYNRLNGISNFIALASYLDKGLIFGISNNTNKLWLTHPYLVLIRQNVFQASISIRNGEKDFSATYGSDPNGTNAFLFGVDYNYNVFLTHAMKSDVSHSLSLNSSNLPPEFIEAVAIQDLFCRTRTTYVQNVGYFAVHKSGNILYFPKVNNAYCIKIGKGKQLNAYLSQDGLSINLYYEFNNKVYKKTLTRPQIVAESNWTLSNTTEEFANIKEFKEWHNNTHLVKNNNFVWSLEND